MDTILAFGSDPHNVPDRHEKRGSGMPKGKPYTAEFKAKVTPEALQGARTVSEIASA